MNIRHCYTQYEQVNCAMSILNVNKQNELSTTLTVAAYCLQLSRRYKQTTLTNMSESMMPVSTHELHHRTLLFELSKPVILQPDKFNEVWPYVDSVYRSRRGEESTCNGTLRVQKYECRLSKSAKSSPAKVAVAEGKVIKRRHSSSRDKSLCHVQIKVSKPVDGTAVKIERLHEHTHTHGIEESFRINKPSILVGFIKSEVAKGYIAFQIYHAFCGVGMHNGSDRLEKIGGSSLKRYLIEFTFTGIQSWLTYCEQTRYLEPTARDGIL